MDKAYIVANEQQEREVLNRLEQERLTWLYSLKKPTAYKPSNYHNIVSFPYVLKALDSNIILGTLDELETYEIVYDGRKENKMKISKEVYDALVEWKRTRNVKNMFVGAYDLSVMPRIAKDWWATDGAGNVQANNRLLAIIRWVNGEDVFEVEKPKKWVVRSKNTDNYGNYWYIYISDSNGIEHIVYSAYKKDADKFDTKEEAESLANSHQEVVEIELDE